MRLRLALAATLAFSSLSSMPAPAVAGNIVVNCSSSRNIDGHVLCREEAGFSFQSPGPHARFALELAAPSTHCSDVRYDVLDSSRTFIGSTRFLRPGEMAIANLDAAFPAGSVRVIIRGWGRVGGCNTGQMHSYGVEVKPIRLD